VGELLREQAIEQVAARGRESQVGHPAVAVVDSALDQPAPLESAHPLGDRGG
jgi:hypothetical protein